MNTLSITTDDSSGDPSTPGRSVQPQRGDPDSTNGHKQGHPRRPPHRPNPPGFLGARSRVSVAAPSRRSTTGNRRGGYTASCLIPLLLLMIAGDVHANPGPDTPSCDICEIPIRANTNYLSCSATDCTKVSHLKQSCSGISRYRQQDWKCPHHRPPETRTIAGCLTTHLIQTKAVPTERTKCLLCSRTIACGNPRMQCRACQASAHKSCIMKTGFSRDAVDIMLQNRAWKCEKCETAGIATRRNPHKRWTSPHERNPVFTESR